MVAVVAVAVVLGINVDNSVMLVKLVKRVEVLNFFFSRQKRLKKLVLSYTNPLLAKTAWTVFDTFFNHWTCKSSWRPCKCSGAAVFCTKCASRDNGVHFFDFATWTSGPNPCTKASTIIFEGTKVVGTPGVLYIWISKCASRHNGLHLLEIAPSKSGPKRPLFSFHLEICFAPLRR